MSVFLLILGLLLFVGLVVVHEFGHFIVARRNGVKVEEFGIGFPPRAWTKVLKSGLLFSINWLPLGGFVRLKGEHDADSAKGDYGAASLKAKSKILLAGVGMNLLAALVLLTVVAAFGMPQLPSDTTCSQFTVKSDEHIVKTAQNKGVETVGDFLPNSPAAKAGVKKGDQLVSLAGQPIRCHQTLIDVANAHAGTTVPLVISRNGNVLTKDVKLNTAKRAKSEGYLGVATDSNETGLGSIRYTWSAPIVAGGTAAQLTVLTLKGLWQALSGLGSLIAGFVTNNHVARQAGQAQATQEVGGPISIFYILKIGSKLGLDFILFIVAIISLTLAIMNVLPIPALDGGRLFVTYLFRLFRRPLKPETEDRIHGTGFLVLILLIVLISIVDIKRFH